jgi:hypothetical protein
MKDLIYELIRLSNDIQYYENMLKPLFEKRVELMETLEQKLTERLQNGTFKVIGPSVKLKLDWDTMIEVHVGEYNKKKAVTSISIFKTETIESVLLPDPEPVHVETLGKKEEPIEDVLKIDPEPFDLF